MTGDEVCGRNQKNDGDSEWRVSSDKSTIRMGEQREDKTQRQIDSDSDRESGANPVATGHINRRDRRNHERSQDPSGIGDAEKRNTVVRELRSIADSIECGKLTLLQARAGKIEIHGKGKQKPTWNGEYGISVVYR